MSVCICIPSRSRPELLAETLKQLSATKELETTHFSVVLDEGDCEKYTQVFDPKTTTLTVVQRLDSLGTKYNIAQKAVPLADIYLLWADDMSIVTPAWDQKLDEAAKLFPDGMGALYFGKLDGVFLPGMAVTQKMIAQMGYFVEEYTSFWWFETWNDEIFRMCDRILHVDIQVKLLGELKGKSRNVQEIAFWAEWFDKTRPLRRQVAEEIIRKGDDQPWRRVQLRQRLAGLEQMLAQRNSKLRDPQEAARLETFYSDGKAIQDDRYLRLKSAAQKMMDELK